MQKLATKAANRSWLACQFFALPQYYSAVFILRELVNLAKLLSVWGFSKDKEVLACCRPDSWIEAGVDSIFETI